MKARSEESLAANQREARRLANASAEAGSKYGQFALGDIFERVDRDWWSFDANEPQNVLYSLAAAQGLDFGQLYFAMFKMRTDESDEEAFRLCYLAAVQGLPDAFEYLADSCNDWDECIYWAKRALAAGHRCAKRKLQDFLQRADQAFLAEHKDMDCNSVSAKLAAKASGVMKEIVDRNLKLFSDRALTQQSHYDATDRQLEACKFFSLASKLKRAIDSGHLPSIADLAWLLLHGREGLPRNREAAFKMAQEGSRRGCPHSQGVLALCMIMDYPPSPVSKFDENEQRRLANASAEAGSKYGQFALGRILENETPNSERGVTAAYSVQYSLAAAQGLDEAQVQWSYEICFETVIAGGGEEEERRLLQREEEEHRLLLLAAAQGSLHACEYLSQNEPDDDGEENYWRERADASESMGRYSAGLESRSATLATFFSAGACLNAIVAADQGRSQLHSAEMACS